MKHVVGVAEMRLSSNPQDTFVTHALGSCLGIAVHDPVARVGGLLHVMLPDSSINPDKATRNPFMFVDTGVPQFFRGLYELGAQKPRVIVRVAGGANVQATDSDRFSIGRRNHIMLMKLFWHNNVIITSEDVGGSHPRTMYLDLASGRVWIAAGGKTSDLS